MEYGYDSNGRLTGVAHADRGAVGIAYDQASRRTLLTLPNGTTTSYTYAASDRLLVMTHEAAFGILENSTYTYYYAAGGCMKKWIPAESMRE
jgi:YD repeat-containing protein